MARAAKKKKPAARKARTVSRTKAPKEKLISKPITGLEADAPVVVDAGVMSVYMDGFQGAILREGIVKLNLYSVQFDPAKEITEKRITHLLTMTEGTFIKLSKTINEMVDDLGLTDEPSDEVK